MSILKDVRKTKKIVLPSYSDSEVILYQDAKTSDMLDITNIENNFETGLKMLQIFIKEWNFKDEAGKPVEINAKSLGILPLKDTNYLIEEINKTISSNELKKGQN